MEDKHKILEQYRSGKISPEEQLELEKLIAKGDIDLAELDTYHDVMRELESGEQLPSFTSLDHRFHDMLDRHRVDYRKMENRLLALFSNYALIWKMALPIFAGVLLFWTGMYYQRTWQMSEAGVEQPTMMATLLATETVNDKIHLISTTDLEKAADDKVIQTLLYTLVTDESTNVRLACIDVLINYAAMPMVREGMIGAINHQISPIVMTSLADAIQVSGQKLSKEQYQSRIRQDLPEAVKKNLEVAIQRIL